MKDLQAHSIGYSLEQHQPPHHQVDDYDDESENFTQPPPQHPLLEQHFSIELELEEEAPLRQQRQENSISDADEEDEDAATMQEGQLFDCPLEYGRQQQSSNFINYCKQNNNPHQSINKPTDGTGSSNKSNGANSSSLSIRSSSGGSNTNNTNIIRYLAATEPGHGDHEPDYEDDVDDEQLFQIDRSSPSRPIGGALSSCSPPTSISSSGSGRLHKPASSPIQVPARRTRRGLHSMKLNMMKVEEEAAAAAAAAALIAASSANIATTDESTNSSTGASNDSDDFSPVRRGDRNRPAILENMPAFDDDDAFLEREFNENHYNHYLVDGFDDEHLTAEEDPMRLFASIQALAKSLHEDAELFGSLPPKRMLESPVRSMAYAR